jgi:gliding motility-associated-like protein
MTKIVVTVLLCIAFLKPGLNQELYNACVNALDLCPAQTYSVSNIGANKTFCPNCEDDFSFCFSANNTIWFKFTTNTVGGLADILFSNLNFASIPGQGNLLQATALFASVPCQSDSYLAIGNCESAGSTNFVLSLSALLPSTTYYVVVSGDMGLSSATECSFDVAVTGEAVDRSAAAIQLDNTITSVCQGQTYTAIAYPQNCPDASSVKWFVNGVLVAQTSDLFLDINELQDGDIVSVEATCYTQCSEVVSSSLGPITVYDFALEAGSDIYLEVGESGQLSASTSALQHEWNPSYNISDTLSLQPFVYPEETTTYTISATQNGCTQSDYVTVFIKEPLVFPTTFSPNGDDINDTWEIIGVSEFPNCFVQIFDRWGQEIYQSTGYNEKKSWDGTYKEKPVPEGVYFYIVKLRDKENKEFKGSITLIR